MGMYYAWLMFYTSWLLVPAVPGIILFLYQMNRVKEARDLYSGEEEIDYGLLIRNQLDTPLCVVYCIILALWATIMMEVWKRREYELAHIWNMSGYVGNDSEKTDFKYEYVIDPITKDYKKKSFINTYLRRLLIELPTIIFCMASVVAVFIGYMRYLHFHNDTISSLISAIVYAVIIVIMGAIYNIIA